MKKYYIDQIQKLLDGANLVTLKAIYSVLKEIIVIEKNNV